MSPRSDEIRLAWVIGRLNVGGPAVFLLDAASALARLGYRSTILTGPSGPREGDLREEAQARGLKVVSIPEMRRELRPTLDLGAGFRIWGVLRRLSPDIVQTQTAKAGALGRLAARAAGVPVVVHTFHGHVFAHYFGSGVSRGIVLAERALAGLADAVVALSASQARELEWQYGVGRGKVTLLPLGIDLEPFLTAGCVRGELRRELGLPAEIPIVAYLGRLIGIKRLGVLLGAVGRLVREGRALFLILVGDGDQRPALEAEARARGLARWVRFTGWRRDVRRVYADAEIVALSSQSEGTPVSILEAMAAGRPVVATRVGGIPDLIEHERSGLLVPPGDEEALAQALKRLILNPEERRAMGATARDVARRRFDVKEAARALDVFYRGLLFAAGAHRPRPGPAP
jgi:glycosyltransferase involved in cell wall biosynthesis